MPLLSFLKRSPAAPNQGPKPRLRRATIEWRDETGKRSEQAAQLQSDRTQSLFALVKQRPPECFVAQVREQGSSYPVEVRSVVELDVGFELELGYLQEGRRRERRIRAQGGALLLAEGTAPIQVEVLNVSSGGMQLFAAQPVSVDSSGRLYGTDTDRICFIRYCRSVPGGYRIGVQFYEENAKNGEPHVGL
jgi:hypothetical protein